MKRKRTLKKFRRLPKKTQRELENLFERQSKINDNKWTMVLNNIRKFLIQYDRIRDRETELEKKTVAIGDRLGFTVKQLHDIRVELIKER
jgi:hypothetical protein